MAGEDDRRCLFSYLEERFGISEHAFEECLLFKRKRSWWLVRQSPLILSAADLKIAGVGMIAFRKVGSFVKPSTRMIQVFGRCATRARFDLDEGQLRRLTRHEPLHMDLELENGYVILSLKGYPLGLGLYVDGALYSQLPRKELAAISQVS